MKRMLLGALEAGGTKMVCATGHANGTVIERIELPTRGPEETVADVVTWFAQRDVCALGIGAFGPTGVNPTSKHYGQILETPKTAWRYFDLLGSLSTSLSVPCGYDTDVNVACLGEVTFGCARGLSDVVYLTIGTGIGAGVLASGRLLHGILHPEAGHIPLARDANDPIGDGSGCPYHPNCLEGLVAGPSIAMRLGERRAKDLAHEGETVDLLAGYLAQALATYILCYSPEKIIVGGGVADNSNLIERARPKVTQVLNGYLSTPEIADIESYIVHNSLDGRQGIMGCLELARQACS